VRHRRDADTVSKRFLEQGARVGHAAQHGLIPRSQGWSLTVMSPRSHDQAVSRTDLLTACAPEIRDVCVYSYS